MNTTVIVAKCGEKNGWYNITTNEGKEISVMASKNPKLDEFLKNVKQGEEVTMNISDKDGKSYGWDPKDVKSGGGARTFGAPKDKGLETYLKCLEIAAISQQLNKEVTAEKLIEMAAKFNAEALKHSSNK